MIDNVLTFLKEQLNTYVTVKTGGQEFQVVYIDERVNKEISFQNNAITILLVNLEEERTFRSGAMSNGNNQINPNLSMNLYVMFVANFNVYSQCLQFLSLVIRFFQSHRLFDHQNSPSLSQDIEKLTMELVSLPFSEQRDIWSCLGMSYVPSVVYKVRMIVFKDMETVELAPNVTEAQITASTI